ncbi:MAG: penicillin acylase family protein [Pseudomonadota bacterium]
MKILIKKPVVLGLLITQLFTLSLPISAFDNSASVFPDRKHHSKNLVRLDGLDFPAVVRRDHDGIAHIRSVSRHDMFFLQGYLHAKDRLFQMDVNRRQANGTLAELLGAIALSDDIELRTLGIRRAAETSWDVLKSSTQDALIAYSNGVNAFIQNNALPIQYEQLELDQVKLWEPIDSLAVSKLLLWQLSFDLSDVTQSQTFAEYQIAGEIYGFNGAALFFEDINRSAPFDQSTTLTPRTFQKNEVSQNTLTLNQDTSSEKLHEVAMQLGVSVKNNHILGRQFIEQAEEKGMWQKYLKRNLSLGSNEWAISGKLTENGQPLIANDPHLGLGIPSTFYPMHLQHLLGVDVIGNTLPGIPSVLLGHNRHIAWGATTNFFDVTDVYAETLREDATSPSGFSTVYEGKNEHVLAIPVEFKMNQLGNGIFNDIVAVASDENIPEYVYIVPRRNNGPILFIDFATNQALSVQYTGFGPTRDMDAFIELNSVTSLKDFEEALEYFDMGGQNIVYADVKGNIGYFTSSELPLREDLQAGKIVGQPPNFIRNGGGGNEWTTLKKPQKQQSIPYEILPTAEMPRAINPAKGWFVNANNDPLGLTLDNNPYNSFRPDGGIFYISSQYSPGFRAGRITQMLTEKFAKPGYKITLDDMKMIQNDVTLLDAQYFTPFIVDAFQQATQSNSHPKLKQLALATNLKEAVSYLEQWQFTTPTGIPGGFDEEDTPGHLKSPSRFEINESISTTLYSLWRSRIIENVINTTLAAYNLTAPDDLNSLKAVKKLFEDFPKQGGFGVSGIDFFNVEGVSNVTEKRDIIILRSLADAIVLLKSEAFAEVFQGSEKLDDYRWGKLHRVIFDSLLSRTLGIPNPPSAFTHSLDGLPGLPTDGGFGVVDDSSHSPSAATPQAFRYEDGPVNRFIAELSRRDGIKAESIWPGGVSEDSENPFYDNLLEAFLTNERIPLHFYTRDVFKNTKEKTFFIPKRSTF